MSTKTSWPFELFTIPRIAFLVVCGIGLTIETGSPAAVFRNVDFPAEGLPIIVTRAVFEPVSAFSVLFSSVIVFSIKMIVAEFKAILKWVWILDCFARNVLIFSVTLNLFQGLQFFIDSEINSE